MKTKSEQEIKEFFIENFKHKYAFRDQSGHVRIQNNMVEVKITWTYSAPEFTEKVRNKIVEFFGTDNVIKYDDISNKGCDTCDYGSSYGYVFRIWK